MTKTAAAAATLAVVLSALQFLYALPGSRHQWCSRVDCPRSRAPRARAPMPTAWPSLLPPRSSRGLVRAQFAVRASRRRLRRYNWTFTVHRFSLSSAVQPAFLAATPQTSFPISRQTQHFLWEAFFAQCCGLHPTGLWRRCSRLPSVRLVSSSRCSWRWTPRGGLAVGPQRHHHSQATAASPLSLASAATHL